VAGGGLCAVDIYTCGSPEPEAAVPVVRRRLGASRCEVMVLERGRPEPDGSIRVRAARSLD